MIAAAATGADSCAESRVTMLAGQYQSLEAPHARLTVSVHAQTMQYIVVIALLRGMGRAAGIGS